MRQMNKPLNVHLTENLDGQSWNWLREKIHLLTSSHLQIMVKNSQLRSKHGWTELELFKG